MLSTFHTGSRAVGSLRALHTVAFCTIAFLPVAAVAQEDYSSWAHTKAITVNTSAASGGAGVTSSLGGFPILVRLTAAHAEIFNQAKAGGADIRFRRLAGPHLPYQIERWDTAAKAADIWVRLDTVLGDNSTQTFNIYWGKPTAADSSMGARVFDLAGGHQGVWHFASNVNDATSNLIHGADEGSEDAAGAIGRGRSFNGGARILLGNHASMSSGDADRYTVEAWVNWSSIGTAASDRYRTIINHGTTNNADQVFLYARNPSAGGDDPHYSFGYYTGSSSNAALAYGIAADGGAWTHVAGVYDGTEWRIYRNGALAASELKNGSPVNAEENWIIGAWGVARYFLGSLDEVRFSNRARSADWLKLSHRTQQPGATVLTFGPTQVPVSLGEHGFVSRGAAFSVQTRDGIPEFRFASGIGPVSVVVSDLTGGVMWRRSAELGAGVDSRTVRADAMRPGVYTVQVFGAGLQNQIHSQRFTVTD